jgi:hypothetical protein
VADSIPDKVIKYFSIYLILLAALDLGVHSDLREMSTRSRKNVYGSKERPVREANNLAAISEPIM